MNWTTTQDGQQYILELTKMIIAEQAPDEAPLVDELVAIYFDNPAPPKQADSARDDPMGSGLSETLIAFSPVIAAMLKKMLDYVLAQVPEILKAEGVRIVKIKIQALFNDKPKQQGITPLTKEQLQQVRKIAINEARLFGVPKDEATRLADAVIGRLVIA